jgi:FtsP/CotA-like multicopper oxidase with cupredoxin domain
MKRHFFLIAFLLLFGAFAMAQAPSIPTCDGYNASNVPVVAATGSTLCTDYFGSPNWANSPLPAGTITGYTVISPGSGYVQPVVMISDVTGTGASATATVDPVGGGILSVTAGNNPTNYTMPQVMIMDTNCNNACGSGAMVSAVLGPPFTGGIRKFVDALPNLGIAVPDTLTFPGSDFYVITLTDYYAKMHSDLPPTKLRGYVQVNLGTDVNGQNTVNPPPQSYLGPVIIAQRGRPVRVLFSNKLLPGQGGDLFIPVDKTYMGANDQQNRATLHLHGGATPWISDGTPHQWTKPAGEIGPGRGVSTAFVPDMWFDATGALLPSCAGKTTCPGGTNDPGAGSMTFYWTNDQGGRLMFYHDHAYGITRLNVYAGEAAGYLLYDPKEEAALAGAGAPGSITAGDLAHLVPLVIQDKTFVPSAEQINATDPTWGGAGVAFGASSLVPFANGTQGNGDLWMNHVYMPNQNPNDPTGGASMFGHWDYGAWFFPPMTTLSAGPNGAVTIPCATAAAAMGVPAGTTPPLWQCPIIPNPSGTPESFMDTPVVNGKAYPVLNVNPEAYRFKILAAGNDRSWNLSWFQADSTGTEVPMLPAMQSASGLPLCGPVTPVAVPALVLGLTGGLLDGTGNPINGTGLPLNCWPNYGPQPGIPATQAMWAGDGRAGGVPDPRSAGPAWIQIGSEGGLLPTPVVIPPTPINYEQNTRSITIGSVAMHGLWLGPAERADAIVDFSKFAGKTLILYNDAPAPAPAIDSRLDYFTGDGDQQAIGGAPNTLPGYGPNTRTIMKVIVGAGTPKPFSLPALKTAFAPTATAPGLFVATQPTIIVPEPAYNSAYGSALTTPKYMGIHDNTMTFTPFAPLNFEALLAGEPAVSPCVYSQTLPPVGTAQCASYNQKAIQELFTLDYGRMNATLGTELPLTNFQNQTTIPLGYVDPATEIVRQGDTQLWKITHNGVDSHFIHFHLFNVQVVNRVGWDGSIRPPDANELGWKDTVRMNPLEDIMVALQPITPPTPWPIPNSVRHNDVTGMGNMFSGLNPFSNGAAGVTDGPTNFGWEYVWHCHILGHEENDMMRPIVWQVPPSTPSNLLASSNSGGGVNVTWTDNSASETGFILQRDVDPAFSNPTVITVATPNTNKNAVGEGTDWGGSISQTDSDPSMVASTTYYYRVQAVDDAFKTPYEQSYNVTSPLYSTWSNTASIAVAPFGSIAPTSLAFGNVTVGTPTTTLANGQLAQVTISNTGNATLTLVSVQTGSTDFSSTASGCTSVAAGATCVFTVTYAPTAVGPASAAITFTTNDTVHPTLSVVMSGAGIVATSISINPPSITFNANGSVTLTVTSVPAGFIPTGNVTLGVDGGMPLSQALVAGTATFAITSPNAGPHTLLAIYATQGGFQGSSASGSLTVNPFALTISPTPNPATMIYGNTVLPTITPSYSGFPTGQGPSNLGTVTCAITGVSSTSPVGSYANASFCSGATNTNYAITYAKGTVNVTQASTATTITANAPNPAIVGQIVTVSFKVTPQFTGTPTGSIKVTASTGETCTGALTAGAGSCTLTFATGGARTLTAVYSGDSNFVTSTSAAANQVVSNVSLSTTSLLFGNQIVGTRSASQTVTLSNVGSTTLAINRIVWSANFSDSTNCGPSLAPGRSCRINVVFVPTTTGVLTGTLTITDSDVTSPQIVTLTGTGVQAAASLSPASWNFGTVARRTTSAAKTFTLTNTGTATLNINSIGLAGASPNQFIISSRTCGTALAPGANCTINVNFAPTRTGAFTATLQITDNAPNSPQTAALSGTGQ